MANPEYWSVDRIENDVAVCQSDDRATRRIPLVELPGELREGDCLRLGPRGYVIDAGETLRRREQNHRLLEQLLRRSSPRPDDMED